MSAPDVLVLPRLPRLGEHRPLGVARQAQAFALALTLHEAGAFTWAEWAETLSAELQGDPADDGARYYEHWVAALERLVTRRNLAGSAELGARKEAWKNAYLRTPHGRPVDL